MMKPIQHRITLYFLFLIASLFSYAQAQDVAISAADWAAAGMSESNAVTSLPAETGSGYHLAYINTLGELKFMYFSGTNLAFVQSATTGTWKKEDYRFYPDEASGAMAKMRFRKAEKWLKYNEANSKYVITTTTGEADNRLIVILTGKKGYVNGTGSYSDGIAEKGWDSYPMVWYEAYLFYKTAEGNYIHVAVQDEKLTRINTSGAFDATKTVRLYAGNGQRVLKLHRNEDPDATAAEAKAADDYTIVNFNVGANNTQTTAPYNMVRAGCTFLGWSTDPKATEADTRYNVTNWPLSRPQGTSTNRYGYEGAAKDNYVTNLYAVWHQEKVWKVEYGYNATVKTVTFTTDPDNANYMTAKVVASADVLSGGKVYFKLTSEGTDGSNKAWWGFEYGANHEPEKNGSWSTFYSTNAPNAEITACKNTATYTLRIDVSDQNSPKVTVLWPYVIGVGEGTGLASGNYAFTEGDGGKWTIENWTMPSVINNMDGYDAWKPLWVGRGEFKNTDGGHSANWSFGWIPFTKLKNVDGCNRTLGAAEGAVGTLQIDANSAEENYALSFDPAGYCLLAYTEGNEASGVLGPLHPTAADPTIWETDLITSLQYDAATYCRTYINTTAGTPAAFGDIAAATRTNEANSMTVARLATDVPQKKNATEFYTDNLDIKYKGRAGKFRIITNSCEANWNSYFVPYIHAKLNANAPEEQITQQSWTSSALLTGFYFSVEATDAERTFTLPPAVEATTGGCPWKRTGYVFKCWDTRPDGLGRTYQPGETITVSEEMIQTETGQYNLQANLYAQWLRQDNVTLHRNQTESDDVTKVQQTVEMQGALLDACAEWTKEGYAIAGWALTPAGNVVYEAGSQIVTMGIDLDLYAVWKATSTVTYHENFGTPEKTHSETCISHTNYDLRRFRLFRDGTPSWSRAGYQFANWNTQADGKGTPYEDATTINLSANLDLYAQWDQLCTITYYANGSDNGATMAAATVPTSKDYTLTKCAYAWNAKGIYFVGWATSQADANNGIVTYHQQQTIQPAGDLNLYAVWHTAGIGDYILIHCNTSTGKADHQLSVQNSSPTTITDKTRASQTSHCFAWKMVDAGNGSQFYLQNYVNPDYYLCCDQTGTLSVSGDGSKTAWNAENGANGNNIYYTDLNMENHYVVWDGTWKTVTSDAASYKNELIPGYIVHKDFLKGGTSGTLIYNELVSPKSPTSVYNANANGQQTIKFNFTWSTEEYFQGYSEAWNYYYKIVERNNQNMSALTRNNTLTEKTTTGFNFVDGTASLSGNNITYSVPVQVTPRTDVPLLSGKPYADYVDSVICTATIDTMHLTQRIAMIRRTYYEKEDDRVTLHFRDAEANDVRTMHFSYDDVSTEQSGTLSGEHHCQRYKYYSYDNQIIEAVGVATADHDLKVDLNDDTETDKFTVVIVDNETGAVATWAEATKTLDGTGISVRMTEQNNKGYVRTARLVITNTHTETVDGEDVSLVTSLSIDISQGSQFTDLEGDMLVRNKGIKNSKFDSRGLQQVHTQEQTYYYLPGDEVVLEPRERHIFGWQFWYDYDNLMRIPDAIAEYPTDYYCANQSNLKLIGIGDNAQGVYGTQWTFQGADDAEPLPAAKVTLHIPGDWTGTHRVAGEFAAYHEFGNTFNTQDRTDNEGHVIGKLIYEPTLSYRELWTLRPASEIADRLEASKTGDFVETYEVIACAEQGVTLTPEHHVFHYSNKAQLGYIYRDAEGNYHRIGDKDDAAALQPKAYVTYKGIKMEVDVTATTTAHFDEVNDYLIIHGFHSGSPGDQWNGTSDMQMTYTMEAGDYKLVKWDVTFKPRAKVGPLTETDGKAIITSEDIHTNYLVLSESNFDYGGGPGTEELTFYTNPLSWEESSSGFFYHNPALRPVDKVRKSSFTDWAFRGEYAFVNTSKDMRGKNATAWYQNRGEIEDGYFMYVDASSAPGLVAMLNVEQHLCSGQKMYCSAWVGNALGGNRDATFADPSLRFDIRGKNADEETWHPVQSYLSGELPKCKRQQDGYYLGDWYQINFEIDLEEDYDLYQVAIYDFAPSGRGNDFVIDDIVIYANELPLKAYQAATSCSTTSVKSVIRMDYEAAKEDMVGYTLYYQVWDKTNGESVAVEPTYLVADGQTPRDNCGSITVPARGQTPTGDKFTSLPAMIQQHDHDVELHQAWEEADPATRGDEPTITCLGFVKEHVPNNARPELEADRWILYIVHDAPMTSEKDYEVRVAYGYDDLSSTQCALTAALPVTNAYDLVINGETQTSLTPTTCGNDEFELSMNVNTIYINPATGKQVKLTGQTLNDWLLLENHLGEEGEEDVDPTAPFDITTWRSQAGRDTHAQPDGTRGYTFDEIERALVYNLRQDVDDNPNRFITSLSQIDMEYLGSADDYQIIRDLVTSGELSLGTATSGVYMHPNDLIRYAVMPVLGSARTEDNQQISMCYTTSFIALAAPPYSNYKLDNGKVSLDSLPEQLRGKPVRMRVSPDMASTSGFTMNLLTRQDVILPGELYLESSTDPLFDADKHWFAYKPNKIYTFDGETQEYYGTSKDSCKLMPIASTSCPAGKSQYTLRPGYEYTFRIDLLTAGGLSYETRGDKECAIGVGYFTLAIVPDYLRWTPGVNGNNNWQDDANWTAVNAMGVPLTGASGYVPGAHSHVIIPVREDGQYPVISTTPDELNNYDMFYKPASCRAIYFESGAKLGNQAQLAYEKALADLTLVSQRWYIVSMPLQEVVSGDMAFYIDGSDNKPFQPLSGEVNRTYNSSYISTYSNSYKNYNPEDTKFEADTIVAANTGWSNVLNALTETLKPGQAFSMMLWRGDDEVANTTIRLPRPDSHYWYYYENGEKSQYGETFIREADKVGKFAFTPNADGTMQLTLTNSIASEYFAFGNPTMAYIDLYKFLQANSSVISGTFYYYSDDQWQPLSTELASYGAVSPNDVKLFALAPERGVMLKTRNGAAANSLTVTLSSDMLSIYPYSTTVPAYAPARHSRANQQSAMLTLTASNTFVDDDTYSSRVRLGEYTNASDAVVAGEDLLCMSANAGTADNGYFATPLNMYVLDDQKALSVDLRESLTCLPLMFNYGNDYQPSGTTRLWAHGVADFAYPLYLCDTLTQTRTRLQEGMYIDIATPAANSLRYYILGAPVDPVQPDPGIVTDLSDVQGPAHKLDVQVVATQNRVGIVSNCIMQQVLVYDVVGHTISNSYPNAEMANVTLPRGVYVIEVRTAVGSVTRKVFVQ